MSETSTQRPTLATTDLDALAFNLNSVRGFVGRSVKYLAVVKANAYGHGSVECSRRLSTEGVDWFGVALPEEGLELRNAGILEPILVLGGFWGDQAGMLIEYNLTPVVFDIPQAELLDHEAMKRGVVSDIHVKIDTGMGRVGIRPESAQEFAENLVRFRNIRLDGLMTHFAVADDLEQNEFTARQIKLFNLAVDVFRKRGFDPTFIDLANSPAAIAHPDSLGNMVRLGGVLYGLGGDVLPKGIEMPDLQPVLSLTSQISHLKTVPAGESVGYGLTFRTERDTVIATIPVGYADGYPRALSNIGNVIVNGSIARIAGRISMDWTTIDVTGIPEARIGNIVTLIGRTDNCAILAEDLAGQIGTISYEITCGIGKRVVRRIAGTE